MIYIKIVYTVNILFTVWVSITCLFFPERAVKTVFQNSFESSQIYRLVGALYLPIFVISLIGLFFPLKMSLILLFQLIYKSAWLLFAALPAITKKQSVPKVMTTVFVIYLIVLPLVIPWEFLF